MKFKQDIFFKEMTAMVDKAIKELAESYPEFEIYTTSIWTDPNGAISSISFDSKENSDIIVEEANTWSKKQHEYFTAEGDIAQANLFEPVSRNCNPADFELTDFKTITNQNMPKEWEENSDGECWEVLVPALKEAGEYAFNKIVKLHTHPAFELSVNGSNDWYEVVWKK